MATRSIIARRNANGTFSSVYVQFDGYLQGVGAELLSMFATPEAVDKLIAGGDRSTLTGHPTEQRTRGAARTHKNYDALMSYSAGCGASYVYVFNPNDVTWKFVRRGMRSQVQLPLTSDAIQFARY